MVGKKIRLERIIDRDSGRTIIVPMDHGVTVGPIEGLADMRQTISKAENSGSVCVVQFIELLMAHVLNIRSQHQRRMRMKKVPNEFYFF